MDRGTAETCRISFQNKFEKLVQLVGFVKTIYHDTRSHKRTFRTVCTDYGKETPNTIQIHEHRYKTDHKCQA
jgi:hypothetical protein